MELGFLAALGAALCWGTYAVPFKISKSENFILFQLLMGIGIVISGLIFSIFAGYSLNLNPYGLISGIIWGIANTLLLLAVSNLGLTKAVPVISSFVIIISFLWGILVFKELSLGIATGFIGIGIIILGVVLVSSTNNTKSQNFKKGLLAACLSGLMFGSQLVPLKLGNVSTENFFFSSCLGIFLIGAVSFFIKGWKFKKEGMKYGIISGVIWNIGNLLSLSAIPLIGLSKAIPISQAATLVAVLWGLFYFKEITEKKLVIRILLGALILLAGVFILSSA